VAATDAVGGTLEITRVLKATRWAAPTAQRLNGRTRSFGLRASRPRRNRQVFYDLAVERR